MSKKIDLDEYLKLSWHFAVESSEWEGEEGYWAWVSELPNCSTFAPTQSGALAAVSKLLPSYLKAALESGATIPTPTSRDPEADDVGGTIVLRLPKSLHIGLKHAAQTENTSLNQFALYALTKMVYQTNAPESLKQKSRTSTGKTTAKKEIRLQKAPSRKRKIAQ